MLVSQILKRKGDLVFTTTPVETVAEHVLKIALHCAAHTLITDVGSTKSSIVRRLAGRLPPGVNFVGSHPLAGSEKTGPENARADLFEPKGELKVQSLRVGDMTWTQDSLKG